ncbi:putative colanic acid biosynthesis acetyltransferase WcaF [Arenibacter palladensis]|uniref:Putative colanic acid biosynthesis acetyltransferase WcaF n=1 Tax=Arenibacter palladensis TaxID=237373 RepID=A0A1M5HNI7_9FLAO|nr:DapH/DapD/GlmU-related protein [Arenibacter palladensis]SHG17481.1 putative colanic acid biosynthesis acetyltransferase WcaF [Arenibacter palladensis]
MDLSKYKEPKPKYLKRIIWYVVNRTIFYCIPGIPFRYMRNLILRAFGAKIPLNTLVYSSCKIWAPWNLEIGKNSCVGPNTELYNKAAIIIGDNSVVSQGTKLYTASHDITDMKHPLIMYPIHIGDKSWIAADCFVGPGVTVGEGAVAGARAVVFKDVAPWTVVGGNPAKFIKNREIKG